MLFSDIEQSGQRLNILVLYDQHSVKTTTVRDHLDCLRRFSDHRFYYAHAVNKTPLRFPLDLFDAVIVHYSVRVAFAWHIAPEFATALQQFTGVKALFIQDEYDNTWTASEAITRYGISIVYTCVPPQHARTIYDRVPSSVELVTVLTGYLPVTLDPTLASRPLKERPITIGYRGRNLPFRYGQLGQEKMAIGIGMRAACEARGLPCDIEWTEEKRIYGHQWPQWIASCRATLGTESGSNVFDFDGSLVAAVTAYLKAHPNADFDTVYSKLVAPHERPGLMNQVSPRVFEAVALRTGLILFEGTYSGVVRPDEHFIPLKKDFSNANEVLDRVMDDNAMSAMIDRAYTHVVGSGLYTYQRFVADVVAVIEKQVQAKNRPRPYQLTDALAWAHAPNQPPLYLALAQLYHMPQLYASALDTTRATPRAALTAYLRAAPRRALLAAFIYRCYEQVMNLVLGVGRRLKRWTKKLLGRKVPD